MKEEHSCLKKKKTTKKKENEEVKKNQPTLKTFFKPTPVQPKPPKDNQLQTPPKPTKTTVMEQRKGTTTFSDLKQIFEAKNTAGDTRGTNLPENFEVPGLSSVVQGKIRKTTATKNILGGVITAADPREKNSREDIIGRNPGEGGLGTNKGSC